mmetsp:Transcript_50128/g.109379  ORF Transcript_50128/g.109379 Transcript_50128/m.109379 type:complete len:257 (-) Transcript_50128:46-816(-)
MRSIEHTLGCCLPRYAEQEAPMRPHPSRAPGRRGPLKRGRGMMALLPLAWSHPPAVSAQRLPTASQCALRATALWPARKHRHGGKRWLAPRSWAQQSCNRGAKGAIGRQSGGASPPHQLATGRRRAPPQPQGKRARPRSSAPGDGNLVCPPGLTRLSRGERALLALSERLPKGRAAAEQWHAGIRPPSGGTQSAVRPRDLLPRSPHPRQDSREHATHCASNRARGRWRRSRSSQPASAHANAVASRCGAPLPHAAP